MELSELECRVLPAIVEKDEEKEILLAQLNNLAVIERDYTGVGVFTKFKVHDNSPVLSKSNRLIEETPQFYLEHPKLDAGVGVILWLDKGRISTLECYTYEGNWPDDESLFTFGS